MTRLAALTKFTENVETVHDGNHLISEMEAACEQRTF